MMTGLVLSLYARVIFSRMEHMHAFECGKAWSVEGFQSHLASSLWGKMVLLEWPGVKGWR